MAGGLPADGQVIWHRAIDRERLAKRRRSFLLLFVAPAVALMLIVLAVAGPGPMAGVAILLGAIGLIVGIFLWANARNLTAKPTIAVVDGQFVCGGDRVRIDQIRSWCTDYSMEGVAHLCRVAFRLIDGSEERFDWAAMPRSELASIGAALAPHIAVTPVSVEEYHSS